MVSKIVKQIAKLETKKLEELREIYGNLYHTEVVPGYKSQLIRKIAYRLQELEYGFLPDKYLKKRQVLADSTAKGKKFGEMSYFKPVTGTKIMKEYHGVVYEVETTAEGFICNGLFFKSLSALASKITGHKTNGLKFFGVKK